MSDDLKNVDNGNLSSRRQFMKAAMLTTGSALLAACGGPSIAGQVKIKPVPTLPPDAVQATVGASVGKSYFPSGNPNVPDAYMAPPPLVQTVPEPPGRGGVVKLFTITYQPPITPKSQNAFWQEANRRLNVDFNILTAPGGNDGYAQKAGALLASGELPDLFLIITASTPALVPAIQQGAFADLTPYLTGEALRQYPNLALIPPAFWNNIKVDGKIYGVPRTRPLAGNVLIFRVDWAKKVGIPDPKNADEFFQLMTAFTKGDPNGNGKADTYGLGRASETANFIHQMFRVPNQWRLESDGSLTPYFSTEEYKASMAYIRKLYAAGIFHPDALTQNTTQSKNSLIAGQIGGYQDGIVGTWGERTGAKKLNPKSDVGVLVPFAADGGKPVSWLGSGNFGFVGISADAASDPARLKELLGILNYIAAPLFSVEGDFINNGIDGWDNKAKKNGVKVQTPNGQKERQDIWGSGGGFMNGMPIFYFADDPPFGPRMQDYVRRQVAMAIPDPTLGMLSATNTKLGARLNQLRTDYFLNMIKGLIPVNAGVDNMYRDWLKNGGAQIRKEFMEQVQKSR